MIRFDGWTRLWVVVALVYGAFIATVAYQTYPRLEGLYENWISEASDVIADAISRAEKTTLSPRDVREGMFGDHPDEAVALLEKMAASPSEEQRIFAAAIAKLNGRHRGLVDGFPALRRNHVLHAVAWWLGPTIGLYALGWSVVWIVAGFRGRPGSGRSTDGIGKAEDRYSAWVRCSFAAARFEQHMPVTVQMLGRLDCYLIEEDSRLVALRPKERDTIPEALRGTDQHTLSYLWVLGAYEVVRTIHQRAIQEQLSPAALEEIAATKRRFARLRVPLAKMEPASAHRDTDNAIAYPARHPELGSAWQVAQDVFISRRDLSDELLKLLGDLRRLDPNLSESG